MEIDNGNGNVEAHEEWCLCSLFSLVQNEKEMKALPICFGMRAEERNSDEAGFHP